MPIILDGKSLTLEQINQVVNYNEKVELSQKSKENVKFCRDYVENIIKENRTVYGLTTGFGKFATIRIEPDKVDKLQENLILSHSTGVGNRLSKDKVRAMMLLRINVLAAGHSGIRLSTLETLIKMLNCGIHPVIPEKGSVGASGDLAPLSHLALALLGFGKVEYKGEIINAKEALEKCDIKPVKLKAKEGLALNNGTQYMTGITALNYLKAEHLVKIADIIAAITTDAFKGTPDAFDELVHKLRPYQGQQNSAKNIYKLLQNSPLRDSHKNCEYVQDPYSIRCTPQVHGAVRTALKFVKEILDVEINSVTDNPLIFPEEDRVISGGNFHGEPVAFAADTLGFTVSELANLSERRMEQLLNPALNRGLNPFLAGEPGLDSGFMIAQLTSASLISENKVLSHPASVDSIPTSANQEDHVSMGATATHKASTIIENTAYVLGIELLAALQALEYRKIPSSPIIEKIKDSIRKKIAPMNNDRYYNDDIIKAKEIVLSNEIIDIASEFIKIL